MVPRPIPALPGRPSGRPRIAVSHDWLCGLRGGEQVLDALVSLIRDEYELAGLYVMVADGRSLTTVIDDAIDAVGVTTSILQSFPGASGRLRRWYLPLYPLAVRSLSRRLASAHRREGTRPADGKIDLLLSSSSVAVKNIRPPITPAAVPHLCYCHAPARYLWGRRADYGGKGLGALRGVGLKLFGGALRRWDTRGSTPVTRFIANSSHIAAQIQQAYGRDSQVVHPPVRTDFFTPDPSIPRGPNWLIVSALEPYKRIDLAIDAALRAQHPLVIVGSGSCRPELERRAAGSGGATGAPSGLIRFAGRVPLEELRDLYRSSSLLLFPQVEDFGIAAVEAMACGLPVVARAAGGALDIINDGVTGSFFGSTTPDRAPRPTDASPEVDNLLDAIRRCPDPKTSASACREAAAGFAMERFRQAMRMEIDAALRGGP